MRTTTLEALPKNIAARGRPSRLASSSRGSRNSLAIGGLALLCLCPLRVAVAGTIKCPDPSNGIVTLQDAIDAAQSNDVILLQPGEYRGNFVVDSIDELTIRGTGKVILDARPKGELSEGPALTVTNCSTITLERFTARNAAGDDADGAGIVISGSNDAFLDRVVVTGCASEGILADTCENMTIHDTDVRGNVGGISLSGNFANLSGVTVQNDSLRGILIFGDDASILSSSVSTIRNGGGIDISGARPTIKKCDVSFILDVDTNGITTSGGEPDLRNNTIRGCDIGMYVVYGAFGTVKGNEIEDCSSSGFRTGNVSHHLDIEKNRVVRCGNPTAAGFMIEGDDQVLSNNSAIDCGGDGFQILSLNCALTKNDALRNLRDGFDIDATATGAILTDNFAKGNASEGFENSGTGTRLLDNRAKANRIEFASDGTTVDEGGNNFDIEGAPGPEID